MSDNVELVVEGRFWMNVTGLKARRVFSGYAALYPRCAMISGRPARESSIRSEVPMFWSLIKKTLKS